MSPAWREGLGTFLTVLAIFWAYLIGVRVGRARCELELRRRVRSCAPELSSAVWSPSALPLPTGKLHQ